MNRLTKTVNPLTTFKQCQLCGFTNQDICSFRMWLECNDQDKPESGNIIITCRQPACQQVIKQHERLYHQVVWGKGEPGWFMLLCSDCKYRNKLKCLHKDLKANGGNGLLVELSSVVGASARICFFDGTSLSGRDFLSATKCEGYMSK